MRRLLNHGRHNVIAYLALFVALGGTTYAATALPAGSVGTTQLRNGAVTPPKLDRHSIGGYVRAWAVTSNTNALLASSGPATVRPNGTMPQLGQIITWRGRFPGRRRCTAVASPTGGTMGADTLITQYNGNGAVLVDFVGPDGTEGVSVALLCAS
jgi:hypothetical protein